MKCFTSRVNCVFVVVFFFRVASFVVFLIVFVIIVCFILFIIGCGVGVFVVIVGIMFIMLSVNVSIVFVVAFRSRFIFVVARFNCVGFIVCFVFMEFLSFSFVMRLLFFVCCVVDDVLFVGVLFVDVVCCFGMWWWWELKNVFGGMCGSSMVMCVCYVVCEVFFFCYCVCVVLGVWRWGVVWGELFSYEGDVAFS